MLDADEIARHYGPWRKHTPADAASLLKDYSGCWWVAGGWAIEAFTGAPRDHGDLDLSVPRGDAPGLVRYLRGAGLDVWAADSGNLHPLVDEEASAIPETCVNLWTRANGASPWEYDVILTDVIDSTWRFEPSNLSLPVDQILWVLDGITYLRPEVQLLYKAKDARPKDDQDFAACLGLLGPREQAWLREVIDAAYPSHQWLGELSRP